MLKSTRICINQLKFQSNKNHKQIIIINKRCINTITENSKLIKNFKDCMSSISSQAMILTAPIKSSPHSTDQISPSELHGMTLSSVASLTLNPQPLLQFNLQVPSITSEKLHDLKIFAFHILPPNNNSVRLARIFSRGINSKPIKDSITGELIHTKPFMNLNENEWNLFNFKDKINLPILKNSEKIIICEKFKVFKIYNHEIWVCSIKDIINNIDDINEEKTGGLLYFNRKFHKIGDSLNEPIDS